ncbi:M15 family metallopeptidase [Plesiomonas shigelloides]|uniref:M15 family metallopeptidase n=1 Tax=Plesiomonas shigelloides TaxID=703 RepID=UPI00326065EA
MMNSLPAACLTGKDRAHLSAFNERHALHYAALPAFLALQQAAARSGFNLQPASSFRDFSRQQLIWNSKYHGQRRVHDDAGNNVDVLQLAPLERCRKILRWSALPGASRHHWGTEIDVYDPDALPAGTALQLEPWEYQPGGYFSELSAWLDEHLAHYDFCRPFLHDHGGVAAEPWHISYHPVAEKLAEQLTPALLLEAWEHEDIAGSDTLQAHLPALFRRYVQNLPGM